MKLFFELNIVISQKESGRLKNRKITGNRNERKSWEQQCAINVNVWGKKAVSGKILLCCYIFFLFHDGFCNSQVYLATWISHLNLEGLGGMSVAFESSNLMPRTSDSNTAWAINSLAKPWAFSQGHIWSRNAICDLARPNSISQGQFWSRKEAVFDLARPLLVLQDHYWSRKAIFDLARPNSISQGLIWSRKAIFDLERAYSISQGHIRSRNAIADLSTFRDLRMANVTTSNDVHWGTDVP